MESSRLQLDQELQPIPALLHSYSSGEPFHSCITCDSALLANGSQYLVEKAIRNYPEAGVQDVIFEYAMCLTCAQQLREELSADSKVNIENYFAEHVNLEARRKALLSLPDPMKLDNWLSHCLVTGKAREDCTEYQIFGQCFGPDLHFGYMPYMLSGEAMDEIQELISPHTREILDDFMDTHFGLPPELRALLQDRLVLV
ncbi:hypothetical protein [Rufibacter roseus]|uniref:Uncharacterized protein n=1 Tax=Rufibacter roseus TaxID=1567108 RepID=A0ABW2DPP9_9BACT|nr:hypothetical protein [Rufibacter roseus]